MKDIFLPNNVEDKWGWMEKNDQQSVLITIFYPHSGIHHLIFANIQTIHLSISLKKNSRFLLKIYISTAKILHKLSINTKLMINNIL